MNNRKNKSGAQPRASNNGRKTRSKRKDAWPTYSLPPVPLGAGTSRIPSTPTVVSRGGVSRVSHTEYVADVSNSTGFSATQYEVNPGLAIFGWLRQSAKTYEKYRWNHLIFEYQPSGAVYTTTGSVYLMVDYDPTDAAPSSLSDALAYESRESNKCSLGIKLKANPRRMFDGVQAKKVRTGPVAGDLSLYDGCTLTVATQDGANTDGIGILLVHYSVDLISPQLTPTVPKPKTLAVFKQTGAQAFTTATEATVEWATELVNGVGVEYDSGTFTLPAGTFLVTGSVNVKDTTGETLTVALNHKKDGAALSPVQADLLKIAVPAGGYVNVPFSVYLYSSGENTYRVDATITGAAGTLTGEAYGQVCFLVV